MQTHGNRDYALTIRQLYSNINRKFNINLSYSLLSSKLKSYQREVEHIKTRFIEEFSLGEICELGYIQMDGIKFNTTLRIVIKSWNIFTTIDCYCRDLFCKCYDKHSKANAVKFYKEQKSFS